MITNLHYALVVINSNPITVAIRAVLQRDNKEADTDTFLENIKNFTLRKWNASIVEMEVAHNSPIAGIRGT